TAAFALRNEPSKGVAMKATIPWLAALFAVGAAAPLAQAQYYGCSPALQVPLLQAPDACGPGFYCVNPCCTVYGPNYCLRPPFEPFNGILPGRQPYGYGPGAIPPPPTPYGFAQQQAAGPQGIPSFATHPYARSPRDFFMWTEAQAERHTRERRLPLVP